MSSFRRWEKLGKTANAIELAFVIERNLSQQRSVPYIKKKHLKFLDLRQLIIEYSKNFH